MALPCKRSCWCASHVGDACPPSGSSTKSTSLWFWDKALVWSSVRCFAQVQVVQGSTPAFSGDHHPHGQFLEEDLTLFFASNRLNFQHRHGFLMLLFPLTPFIKSAQFGWWGQNQIQILGEGLGGDSQKRKVHYTCVLWWCLCMCNW